MGGALGFTTIPACYSGGASPEGAADAGETDAGPDADADDGSGSGDDADDGDDDLPAEVGASDLRRLSGAEYVNTIRALFGDAVTDEVAGPLSLLPGDRVVDGYATMARGVTAPHVDTYFLVASGIAEVVASDVDARSRIDPCLADEDAGDACVDGAIADFGRRAFRRTLSSDEQAMLRATWDDSRADGFSAAVQDLVIAVLMSPQFVYLVEVGELDEATGIARLSGVELASRLSYLAWGSPPDAELLDAAEAGELATQVQIETQVARLFADERARQWLPTFFTEFLDLDLIPPPPGDADFLDGLPSDGLSDAMRDEVDAFIHSIVFEGGGWPELMMSRDAVVDSPALAQIYGVEASAEVVELPPTRAGLLTRAGMLTGSGVSTAPILRGARVLERVLCQPLVLPDPEDLPPGAEVEEPPLDPNATARERWTALTSEPACAACHSTINPFGFALEGLDSVGRLRTSEPVLDEDGAEVNSLPIDDVVDVTLDGEVVTVAGAVGLSEALAGSVSAAECFAEQWFRFSHGRVQTLEDADDLAATRSAAAEGVSLLDVMQQLAARPEYRAIRYAP
ncbi:MAG: DUF1592 domain-containing protein [Myxococcota bacterium]